MDELKYIIEAIEGNDTDMLLRKALYLKGTDGEGWAVGEMLERAVRIMNKE